MRRILITGVVLATVVTLSGCSSMAASQSAGFEGSPGVAVAPSTTTDTAGGVGNPPSDANRQVITTGSVTITAENPADAATDAVRIVESSGGRVDARTERAPEDGDRGSARLTLRVPSSELTATLDELKKLGTVREVKLSTSDVTTQSQDLDARITALRSSVDRLTKLLATAKDTKVLIELETAITERQGNLESMESQQRSLADQVSMSTIELTLRSVADAPAATPDTFWSGLATGWSSFVAFVSGTLVVIGVLIPWVVFLGIVAAIAVFVIRRALRRGSAAASASVSVSVSADAS